jgi:phosphoribosylformimino-5-aminoimidazole carboxamide ribotide isomerase
MRAAGVAAMIVMPAIDVREGACVQLVGGRYEDERVRLPDPVAVARRWAGEGLRALHVVDLDAATGRGSNDEVILRLLAEPGLEVQVGGGVRSEERIAQLLAAGAHRVVLGTRAIEDPVWLGELSLSFPGRIVVAADVVGRRVATRGWRHIGPQDVRDVVSGLERWPLAGLLVTAIDREGRLEGPDLELMAEIVQHARHPVLASGGITSVADLRALETRGVHGAVLGMAIYTGVIGPEALRKEFAT